MSKPKLPDHWNEMSKHARKAYIGFLESELNRADPIDPGHGASCGIPRDFAFMEIARASADEQRGFLETILDFLFGH